MKKLLFYFVIAFAILSSSNMMAQQGFGTNTPDKSAAVDIVSTKRGMLIPRVALTATNAAAPVSAPATSLLVYNTATDGGAGFEVTPGFYYWDSAKWVRFMDTDSNHTTSVVQGQGIIVEADTTDPNNTEYTVSVAPGASDEMVLVTIEDPLNPGEFITEWVSYADFLDDLIAADNGLFYDEATGTVELGGTLTRNTEIATGAFNLTLDATGGSIIVEGLDEMDIDTIPADATVAVMLADGTVQKLDLADLIAQTTYTADNGLTMADNNVQLGGALTEDTTEIDINNKDLIFNVSDTANGGSLQVKGLTDAAVENTLVVRAADGTLHQVVRSVSATVTTTAGLIISDATVTDYSPYVPEVNIAVTLPASGDVDVELPVAAAAKGQVINIRITNTGDDDDWDGYCNIKLPGGGSDLTYGSMPYQGWIVKSDGANWVVVGRN